jgi:hypothetical protein
LRVVVCITLAITCEAHIDEGGAIRDHRQLQRFDRFIALFCSLFTYGALWATADLRRRNKYPSQCTTPDVKSTLTAAASSIAIGEPT